MFRTILAPAVIVAALAVAACGGDDDGEAADPAEFGESLIEQLVRGQYGRAYETMHPAQQEFITRDFYMSCAEENASAIAIELEEVETLEVYEEENRIPGTDITSPSMAVTQRIEVRSGEDTASYTDTGHLYEVDGEWRWVWSEGDAAREGNCQ